MGRKALYDFVEKPIKLKVPIILCPQGHKHIPVGKEKKCLVCEYTCKKNV